MNGLGPEDRYYKLDYIVHVWPKKLLKCDLPKSVLTDFDYLRLRNCLATRHWFRDPEAPYGSDQEPPPVVEGVTNKAKQADLQTVRECLWQDHTTDRGEQVRAIPIYVATKPGDNTKHAVITAFQLRAILHSLFRRISVSTAASTLQHLEDQIDCSAIFFFSRNRTGNTRAKPSPAGPFLLDAAPVEYLASTMDQLKYITSSASKHNKSLNDQQAHIQGTVEYQRLRQMWCNAHCSFISIDTEHWERGSAEDLLELGWSIIQLPDSDIPHPLRKPTDTWTQQTEHRIISENTIMANGKYVPDNRAAFLFDIPTQITVKDGMIDPLPYNPQVRPIPDADKIKTAPAGFTLSNGSIIVDLERATQELDHTIKSLREKGPVYVVFHDSSSDLGVLNQIGVSTDDWTYSWDTKAQKQIRAEAARQSPNPASPSGSSPAPDPFGRQNPGPVTILDTRRFFATLEGKSMKNGTNLGRMISTLASNLGTKPHQSYIHGLHNAANDAHYTLLSMAIMASGPGLSVHRARLQERMEALERIRVESLERKKAQKALWRGEASTPTEWGPSTSQSSKKKLEPWEEDAQRQLESEEEARRGWDSSEPTPTATKSTAPAPPTAPAKMSRALNGWENSNSSAGPSRFQASARPAQSASSDGWRTSSISDSNKASYRSGYSRLTAVELAPDSDADSGVVRSSRQLKSRAGDSPLPASSRSDSPMLSSDAEARISALEDQVASLTQQLQTLAAAVLSNAQANAALQAASMAFSVQPQPNNSSRKKDPRSI